jgi:hypothetical protein
MDLIGIINILTTLLRRTSRGLRDLPTDKHIYYTFLDPTIHYMDAGST